MSRRISALALAVVLGGAALGGCGGSAGADGPSAAQVTAAVSVAAQELDPEAPRAGADREAAVSRFMGLLNALHEVPALSPLFDRYDVPYPAGPDGDGRGEGLVALLRAVRIARVTGVVYVTNRATGSVIYASPEADLGHGTLEASALPASGEPPPPGAVTCMSFAYSAWGACRTDGTSSRTVLASSPSGCAGGAPATTRPCDFTPRPVGP